MNTLGDDTLIAVSMVQNCLLVSIQGVLYDPVLKQHQAAILEQAQATKANGVILDFNAVSVLDTFAFQIFSGITKSLFLMGVPTVWVALNPGVVSSLIDLNVNISGICTARTLEAGLQLLEATCSGVNPRIIENNYNYASTKQKPIKGYCYER